MNSSPGPAPRRYASSPFVGTRQAAPVLPIAPTLTVSLSPLNATLTKNEGDPPPAEISCSGAACCAPNLEASHPGTHSRRLPPEWRANPHSETNPFKRNAYKNKGGAR
jgi:hypothetical protein